MKRGKDNINFDSERQEMVETQIVQKGINEKNVIEVMLKVPRHLFVPEKFLSEAYNDYPLPTGDGQTISQPYMVALMTELLQLTIKDRTLEIGTGSGYQTAILSELSGEVYTIERNKNLSEKAEKLLSSLGYKNIKYKIGDGTTGWKEFGPYSRILITAGSNEVPKPLLDQLSNLGKMVIPIGNRLNQILTVIEKINDNLTKREICGCMFVPLIGEYGWKT